MSEKIPKVQKRFSKIIIFMFIISIALLSLSLKINSDLHKNKLENTRKAVFNNYMEYKSSSIKLNGIGSEVENRMLFTEIMKTQDYEKLKALDKEIYTLKTDLKAPTNDLQNNSKVITRNIEEYLSNPNKYEFEGVIDMSEINKRDSGSWGVYNTYFIYNP